MSAPVLFCTDGSDLSLDAIRTGHALVTQDAPRIVVTVVDVPDDAELVGSGHAGPGMTPEQLRDQRDRVRRQADDALAQAGDVLGRPHHHEVLDAAHPGKAIVELAVREDAAAIVIGSRGRGGLKRAMLGSVSDYVVRNAPCPVVVHPAGAADES